MAQQPGNPFGAAPPQAFGAPAPPQQAGNPFDPYTQAPAGNQQATMPVAQGPGADPFGSQPSAIQPQQQAQAYQPDPSQQNAMVPAGQQANPFEGALVAAQPAQASPWAQPQEPAVAAPADPWAAQPAAADPFGAPQQQALVPAAQPASQWASPAPAPAAANPLSFDPFAAPPAPPQPAAPPPPAQDPFPAFSAEQQQQALVPAAAAAPEPSPFAMVPAPEPAAYALETYNHEAQQQQLANGGAPTEMVPFQAQPEMHHVNKYSSVLANTAPEDAAPLPQGEKVLKSGYVLSRISFRTILLKKWKQTYWVQYGPHTMLWFRSHADFDDWLNNPYHTQQQRNFLIKLAVNFVHDLYKPNVRGYQVTQARSKQYKKKFLRQFKLERWMDYGPTIAAAFASHDPKEVDELRQAIVECMRNTPLGDGVRATGAVRTNNDGSQRDDNSVGAHSAQGYGQGSK